MNKENRPPAILGDPCGLESLADVLVKFLNNGVVLVTPAVTAPQRQMMHL